MPLKFVWKRRTYTLRGCLLPLHGESPIKLNGEPYYSGGCGSDK